MHAVRLTCISPGLEVLETMTHQYSRECQFVQLAYAKICCHVNAVDAVNADAQLGQRQQRQGNAQK